MTDQRPWFTREDTGTIQFADDRQAAVRRVIARGSTPEAVEEAEGDFGPGGSFSLDDCPAGRTDPHQCDCLGLFDMLTTTELYDLHTILCRAHGHHYAQLFGPGQQPRIEVLGPDWLLIRAAMTECSETIAAVSAEIDRRDRERINA